MSCLGCLAAAVVGVMAVHTASQENVMTHAQTLVVTA